MHQCPAGYVPAVHCNCIKALVAKVAWLIGGPQVPQLSKLPIGDREAVPQGCFGEWGHKWAANPPSDYSSYCMLQLPDQERPGWYWLLASSSRGPLLELLGVASGAELRFRDSLYHSSSSSSSLSFSAASCASSSQDCMANLVRAMMTILHWM